MTIAWPGEGPSARPHLPLWIAATAFGAVSLATLALFLAALFNIVTNAPGATGDFISFYAAGEIVGDGQGDQLYDEALQEEVERAAYPGRFERYYGYVLPVFAAWIFVPFAKLPFTAAFLAWMAICVAALAWISRDLMQIMEGVPRATKRIFLATFLFSMPVVAVVTFGQVDFIVLGAFLAGWSLLRRGHDGLAGAAFAAAAIKPHFLVGIFLWLLLARRWKTLATLCAVSAALLVVPALLTSPSTLVDNAGIVGRFPGANEDLSVNAEMMSNWRGFVVSTTGSTEIWLWLPGLAVIGIAALMLALPVWRASMPSRGTLEHGFALAVMLPLLVSPHLHTQSLILLYVPLAFWLSAAFAAAPGPDVPAMERRSMTLLLCLHAMLFVLWLAGVLGIALLGFLLLALYGGFALRWPQAGVATSETETPMVRRAA